MQSGLNTLIGPYKYDKKVFTLLQRGPSVGALPATRAYEGQGGGRQSHQGIQCRKELWIIQGLQNIDLAKKKTDEWLFRSFPPRFPGIDGFIAYSTF